MQSRVTGGTKQILSTIDVLAVHYCTAILNARSVVISGIVNKHVDIKGSKVLPQNLGTGWRYSSELIRIVWRLQITRRTQLSISRRIGPVQRDTLNIAAPYINHRLYLVVAAIGIIDASGA